MVGYSHERYDQLLAQTIEKIKQLGRLKGGEYAGDDDRLANFRHGGERIKIPMETTWWVYANKHWDAITQFVQDIQTGKKRERLEGLAGRADDLIVYLLLFKAMIDEREQGETISLDTKHVQWNTTKEELKMIGIALGRRGDSIRSSSDEMRMAEPWYDLEKKIMALVG